MTRRQGAAVVIVAAFALLGASVGGTVATVRDSGDGGHYAYGPAMMGFGYRTAKASPVSSSDARQRAQAFAGRLGLTANEVLRFERNYYVTLVDKQGSDATELLVDPATGAVSLEYGPAMMWNTKYGMMNGRYGGGMMSTSAMGSMMGSYGRSYGGMMGGGMMGSGMMGGASGGMMGGASESAQRVGARVTLERAHVLAQRWLDANEPGTTVESEGDALPGYYTLETRRDGRISAMLSVNATGGAVWPHWWHGRFLAISE